MINKWYTFRCDLEISEFTFSSNHISSPFTTRLLNTWRSIRIYFGIIVIITKLITFRVLKNATLYKTIFFLMYKVVILGQLCVVHGRLGHDCFWPSTICGYHLKSDKMKIISKNHKHFKYFYYRVNTCIYGPLINYMSMKLFQR